MKNRNTDLTEVASPSFRPRKQPPRKTIADRCNFLAMRWPMAGVAARKGQGVASAGDPDLVDRLMVAGPYIDRQGINEQGKIILGNGARIVWLRTAEGWAGCAYHPKSLHIHDVFSRSVHRFLRLIANSEAI